MQLILFTSNDKFRSEIYIVIKLLEGGLETLHIKKPNFSRKQLSTYIGQIPKKFHNRLVIHSHYSLLIKYNLKGIHLSRAIRKKTNYKNILVFLISTIAKQKTISCSCHSVEKLLEIPKFYSYVFLSPMFKSGELNSDFNVNALANIIPQLDFKVHASSGINLSNLDSIQNIGFHGIATMGSIWFNDEKQPISHFKDFTNKLTTLS